VFSTPKGVLLYGPPGTGKSALTKALCEFLNVQLITEPMAAGDFNKGIVGDSEAMLNEIASRAQLIPWEMCVVLIDEIDSLAPNRMSKNADGKQGGLLGVLLAILDGTKTTSNLKIIATTNLKDSMDDAFLRRMSIKLFLGNPSYKARYEWIGRKALECRGEDNY
jgi:SpoVK/Ycf46/Vps4 family AAA+-type ATPase